MSIFRTQGLKRFRRIAFVILFWVSLSMGITLIGGKIFQQLDRDPYRGAMNIQEGEFNEGYSVPVYLDQGWNNADSLWFYTTTQGSVLLPLDFFIALEQSESETLFLDPLNIDKYRYLPQRKTFFNEHALPVGFAVDEYRNKDYVGYTCAACHTAQINYNSQAIRIDGGPAMADMVGFLSALTKSMQATLDQPNKFNRFANKVIALDNDYENETDIREDLQRWTSTIQHYNQLNHSNLAYGYARLDAFGRIYNRVLQHVINRDQLRIALQNIADEDNKALLDPAQIELVIQGLNETIVGDDGFAKMLKRLQMTEPGYPALNDQQMMLVKDAIFNEPNAPVSYPFLWDITHSDYVQWNGLANNATLGPLGRNTGEVIGVFAKLDWEAEKPGFSLSAKLTGQENKKHRVKFTSSVDGINLERLEGHLHSLKSPVWPQEILGKIDQESALRGQRLYAEYCESCHQIINRSDFKRLVTANMSSLDVVGTDPVMAENSVNYKGYAGNFANTYLAEDVGTLVLQDQAAVAQILTAVTKGVVVTPDTDKNWFRRRLDQLYMFAASLIDNPIKPNVKHGNYKPDTTASPYQSLLAYKGRSLNGIWATAPYLHNGSVPSLYELLLPKKREGDAVEGLYRPDTFVVGSRKFDPKKVGFRDAGYSGTLFDTSLRGNGNQGHEYGTTHTSADQPQRPLTDPERWDLVEYMKTL
jgi:cytochrome c1